ncbi:type VII secretion protein EccB [Rhodococcus kroppenstedtii]|uniref:type VII secretion protein EccB n=1 Tax=Rhodococcoides kroppenstedtii TaxID=293050 RepID=UPI001C9AA1DB|nr:type VII secretion protein EccB [Rhodococcus kroppenstedtii]MBY6436072.1 type VII secretion protein EccB [Rhodococcus kroppenstedtii]
MGREPVTKWQVGAHRFATRRVDVALVQGDSTMRHDPMRASSRATAVGAVIAVLVLAGCGILAFLRPAPIIGDADIVRDDDTGALYVVLDGVLHPTTGLASARLIVGRPDDPVGVPTERIAERPRGAAVGIVDAPHSIAVRTDATVWSVCDRGATSSEAGATTVGVTADPTDPNTPGPRQSGGAVLWQRDGITYLLHDGVRSRLDPADTVLMRALGLDDAQPVRVSAALLDSVPESRPLEVPRIDGVGTPVAYALGDRRVGSVVTVDLGDRSRHYVALADGIQAVGPAVAQVLRFSDSAGRVGLDAIAPDVIARAPRTERPLDVSAFPEAPPQLAAVGNVCAAWSSPAAGPVVVTTGDDVPAGRPDAVVQPGADGGGDAVDRVELGAGAGVYVIATDPLVAETRRDGRFYVSDTGVRYGVPTDDDASALGLGEPVPVPWSMIARLPAGPTLDADAARRTHDGPPLEAASPGR